MTSATLELEDFRKTHPELFATGRAGASPPGYSREELEEARAAGYEQGYSAGWDDANAAAEQEQSRIGTELAHNLLDLSFTFHEARAHVVRSVAPLLAAMVDKLLPELVAEHLGRLIIEQAEPLIAEAADRPIRIQVAPARREQVQRLLDEAGSHPFELVEEPSFTPGQARLTSGERERFLDLDAALAHIRDGLAAIDSANQEVFASG